MRKIWHRFVAWLNSPVETYLQLYWLFILSIAIVMAALFVLVRI